MRGARRRAAIPRVEHSAFPQEIPLTTPRRPSTILDVPAPRTIVRRASLAEVLALRHQELRPGLPVAAALFDGDDAPTTSHYGAFLVDGGENVGCASLMTAPWRDEPALQLRGMATRADLVRTGIGSALLRFVEDDVRRAGGPRLLWCNARVPAVPFYERLGWTVGSTRFEIASVGPHHAMVRRC
jgi:GNAT superfamily N-acetyltransferase